MTWIDSGTESIVSGMRLAVTCTCSLYAGGVGVGWGDWAYARSTTAAAGPGRRFGSCGFLVQTWAARLGALSRYYQR
jgi:hypothetical protein